MKSNCNEDNDLSRVCCLNRPFDDQHQHRIRLESEAILFILEKCYNGEWRWLASDALNLEIDQTPHVEKRQYLSGIANFAHDKILIKEDIMLRAKDLVQLGFKSFDAIHIACAEKGDADLLLTTDDKLLKLAARMESKLYIKVANPLTWLMENL